MKHRKQLPKMCTNFIHSNFLLNAKRNKPKRNKTNLTSIPAESNLNWGEIKDGRNSNK